MRFAPPAPLGTLLPGRAPSIRHHSGGTEKHWPAGPMARRLTTNQEIAGSTPASVIFCFALKPLLRSTFILYHHPLIWVMSLSDQVRPCRVTLTDINNNIRMPEERLSDDVTDLCIRNARAQEEPRTYKVGTKPFLRLRGGGRADSHIK